jgi:hypothetical protein
LGPSDADIIYLNGYGQRRWSDRGIFKKPQAIHVIVEWHLTKLPKQHHAAFGAGPVDSGLSAGSASATTLIAVGYMASPYCTNVLAAYPLVEFSRFGG